MKEGRGLEHCGGNVTTKLDTSNVFVKFLPIGMDDEQLSKLFSPFGTIVSAKVMLDPQTGRTMGYGYENQSY